MKILSNDSTIIIKEISFKAFPNLKKLIIKNNTRRRTYYKGQIEKEMEEGTWNIWVFKGTRNCPPSVSFIRLVKGTKRRTIAEINIGIDWLMKRIKEDDNLLGEFFVLRTFGFKD